LATRHYLDADHDADHADNKCAGLCFSGEGEIIARLTLAFQVMHQISQCTAEKAIERALDDLGKMGGEAVCIFIDKDGYIAWSHNSSHFAAAYQTSHANEPTIRLKKEGIF
jgi:beta-aspartyl-peptidase (threonine type)